MRTEAQATEEFTEKVKDLIGRMTPANWMLLRRHLDMTREEISEDQGLTLLTMRWVETGTTAQNLQILLDTPEKQLAKDLGMDPDEEFAPEETE